MTDSPEIDPAGGGAAVISPMKRAAVLLVGTASVSSAAVLIVLSGVDPAGLAVWRLGAAALLFLPFAARRFRADISALSGRERWWLALGGICFGLHFVLFNTGFRTTSYESTVVLLAAQPLFAAFLGRLFLGERVTAGMAVSTGVGAAGLAVLVWRDYRFDPQHIAGDCIVLACCVLLTIAYVFTRGLRAKLGVSVFVVAFYSAGAATSAVYMVLAGQGMLPQAGQTQGFVSIALLIIVPTLLGHTVYSYGLKFISAFTINLVVLAEPVVAIAMKYALRSRFHEFQGSELSAYHVAGGVILSLGIVIGLAAEPRPRESGRPSRGETR